MLLHTDKAAETDRMLKMWECKWVGEGLGDIVGQLLIP